GRKKTRQARPAAAIEEPRFHGAASRRTWPRKHRDNPDRNCRSRAEIASLSGPKPQEFGKLAMAKILHSMIRFNDENRSVDFYKKAFGLEVAQRFQFDEFTLVYLRNPENDFELELTINNGRTEPYSHGDGYGHLAIAVDDIAKEHAHFEALGLNPKPVKEFK